jgi:4-hydroxybenzoate polyprenyltransferase
MSEILDNEVQNNFQGNQTIPGAGGILTMGILSIVFAGIIGVILGIIALNNSKDAMRDYNNNPSKYNPSSLSQVKAGKVCAIIGLSLAGFVLLIFLVLAMVS